MCFERFGITKTTMEDVARAAKMSRATVYRHFSDRESLILASVTRRARMNIEPARSYIANCRTLEDKIVEESATMCAVVGVIRWCICSSRRRR